MKYKVGDEVLVKCKIINADRNRYLNYEVSRAGCNPGFSKPPYILAGDDDIETMTSEEAWEIAKRIEILSTKEMNEIFGYLTPVEVINNFSPQEAKDMIEAWEKAKEIKVGDFVEIEDKIFCVTSLAGEYCCGIDENGSVYSASKKDTKKTGRHIDIDGILKQIGGDE